MNGLAAAALAVALAGCAGAVIEMPEEAAAQASRCSAVRALALGEGRADDAPVSFADFGEILHPAMITAARAETGVDLRQLMTISQDAPVAMEELRSRNWRSLVEPCAAAFPEAQRRAGELPPDSFESGMICFGLADFLARTATDYPREREAAAGLADRALAAATPVLTQRSGNDEDALQISDRYMARAFLAGTPASVLDQCARRFPMRSG